MSVLVTGWPPGVVFQVLFYGFGPWNGTEESLKIF